MKNNSIKVVQLGTKVENKGIVLALSKKQYNPNIQTLKKEGFNVWYNQIKVF